MTARDCPDPSACPVPDPSGDFDWSQLVLTTTEAGRVVCRSYQLHRGYDSFNPGHGDTRFAPLAGETGGTIPTMYMGDNDVVALLETVLHDIHHVVGDRVLYYSLVRKWGLAYIELPAPLVHLDLRNDALAALGLTREQLVSPTAEHYRCTREWAQHLRSRTPVGTDAGGIIWHSRQAELKDGVEREVMVLFGDRVTSAAGSYPLAGPGVRNLTEGPGRVLLERLAEDLGARLEPDE